MVANYKQFLEGKWLTFGGKWDFDLEFDETKNWFGSRKFRTYKADAISLFGTYFSNPGGRVRADKNKKQI